jgi:hypothetical protein
MQVMISGLNRQLSRFPPSFRANDVARRHREPTPSLMEIKRNIFRPGKENLKGRLDGRGEFPLV